MIRAGGRKRRGRAGPIAFQPVEGAAFDTQEPKTQRTAPGTTVSSSQPIAPRPQAAAPATPAAQAESAVAAVALGFSQAVPQPAAAPTAPPSVVDEPPRELYEEYCKLWCSLTTRPKSVRDHESTIPGEPAWQEEIYLPSTFCYYPELRRRVLARAGRSTSEAVELMRSVMDFLISGDKSKLLDQEAMGFGARVDLTEAQAPAAEETTDDQPGQWQVHLGEDEGWLDFDHDTNALCEAAWQSGSGEAVFCGHGGAQYNVSFSTLLQTNLSSGTVRPVRRTTAALFG